MCSGVQASGSGEMECKWALLVYICGKYFFHGHVAYVFRWFGVEFIDLSFPYCVVLGSFSSSSLPLQ